MSAGTEELLIPWNGLTLAGTLHAPTTGSAGGDGPFPTVLMMQGSGPADRDSDGYFTPIREAFLSRGIATYSFDKPGCGSSTGDWRDYALNGRADQADAALDLLAEHRLVDRTRRGIWGQSQGGWLAQLLAGRRDDLAFAIANSGPSIGVQEQDRYGCEHTLRADGYDETQIGQALETLGRIHDAAHRRLDYATVRRDVLEPVAAEPWFDTTLLDASQEWEQVMLFATERFLPLQSLATVSCPFLAIYGGKDRLVPAWRGAAESGQALADAPTEDATVVVFPTGDHRIRDGGEFVPGYLDLLGDWAAARTNP